MTRKRALVLAAVPASLLTVWAVAWAYATAGPAWFATFAVAFFLLALLFGVFCQLTSEGRHAGSSTSGSEEESAVPPVATVRPVRTASEPPREFLAAPVAAPATVPVHHVDKDGMAWYRIPGPPEISHDEYAPDQYRDGHAHMDGGVLTPVLAPALLAVAILRAHIAAAIVTDAQQGSLWDWTSDSFVGAIPVVLDEDGLVARPAVDAAIPVMTPEQIALMDAEHAEAAR
jgi:hypothetical protein